MNKPATRTRGAVIYTRVSTGEQDKHGTSPETQRDACRAKALALGLPIIAEYYDGGISGGFLLMRKEFQAAIADIQAGRADTLICLSISRFSRDVEHQQAVKKAIKAAGGHLVFCDMTFEDTPEGDLNFTIQGSFAEYEKAAIRERLARGRQKRAAQGQQPSRSRPPYGYYIVGQADILRGLHPAEMIGRYVVDEARAPLIRELYTRYAAGQAGMPALCQDLNARGIPTSRGGRIWYTSTLRAILTNPVYKGLASYGRTITHSSEARLSETHRITGQPLKTPRYREDAPEGRAITFAAPPLVSAEVWEEAQRRMASNRTNIGGNPNRVRMLSGRVFCPCGHPATLVSAPARVSDYYRCSVTRNSEEWEGKGNEFCEAAYYRVDIAERAVASAFLSAAQNPQALEDARRLYAARAKAGQPQDAADLRVSLVAADHALTKLRDEEAAAVQAQIAGIRAGASPDAYAAAFADIAARRKDLEDWRGQLARALDAQRPSKAGQEVPEGKERDLARQALEDAALVLSASDVPGQTKRDIVSMVIGRVVCQRDGAEVYFLPGFAPTSAAALLGESEGDTLHSSEEFWYILAGTGRFHRLTPDGSDEETADIAPGDALLIPTGYRFWAENTGLVDLVFLCLGTPPWPGPEEAIVWAGT